MGPKDIGKGHATLACPDLFDLPFQPRVKLRQEVEPRVRVADQLGELLLHDLAYEGTQLLLGHLGNGSGHGRLPARVLSVQQRTGGGPLPSAIR